MSDLRQALQDYLAVRRALGFKLARADQRLSGFIGFLEQPGRPHGHHRAGARLVVPPPGAHPGVVASAADPGPRFREVPAHPGPGHRGATGRAAALRVLPGHALPVFRR